MAAYRRVYDSRHLQADCQEPVIEYGLPLFLVPLCASVRDVRASDVTIIFAPPGKQSLHNLIAVLIHDSGHFGFPLPFWAPGPPALPGLPMASYATGSSSSLLLRP